MTYFLPSSLQKRILRYALSRLELLDTDGLDLEKLDIVWGKRSTVELREVGVHLTVRTRRTGYGNRVIAGKGVPRNSSQTDTGCVNRNCRLC